MALKKIYLAGPDVFLADARRVGLQKQQLCREHGFKGLFPLDNDKKVGSDPVEIFRANCSLMRQADVGLFNLTPFRGPSADAGTVFELGFFFAQGKPVYGYSSVARTYRERVAAAAGLQVDQKRLPRDRDGHTVEDFGLYDNLMIERAIHDSGGVLITIEEKSKEAAVSLAAFRAFTACLMAISDRIKPADATKPSSLGGRSSDGRTSRAHRRNRTRLRVRRG